jgi:hypothetical protein
MADIILMHTAITFLQILPNLSTATTDSLDCVQPVSENVIKQPNTSMNSRTLMVCLKEFRYLNYKR